METSIFPLNLGTAISLAAEFLHFCRPPEFGFFYISQLKKIFSTFIEHYCTSSYDKQYVTVTSSYLEYGKAQISLIFASFVTNRWESQKDTDEPTAFNFPRYFFRGSVLYVVIFEPLSAKCTHAKHPLFSLLILFQFMNKKEHHLGKESYQVLILFL